MDTQWRQLVCSCYDGSTQTRHECAQGDMIPTGQQAKLYNCVSCN
jgi:hypothetical protein